MFAFLLAAILIPAAAFAAEDKQAAAPADTDVIVLSNGDTLHGKLVKEVTGKVTFHTDAFGDVDVPWEKIKELHAAESFGIVDNRVHLRRKKNSNQIPVGPIDVTDQGVAVRPANAAAAPAPIPIKSAEYIIDAQTLDTQLNHMPGFFTGWNGGATAGATLVAATQNQYSVSGSLGLVRAVPTVAFLPPRNRTLADFSGSYGKITERAFTVGGVTTPAVTTKSSIFHIDAERDQYLSDRIFALVQTAFDHNFSQDLQLQQIYGGGLGVTLFNTPTHEADVKGTVQYEKQAFISGSSGNQNLIGSTFSANYGMHRKIFTFVQELAYIPAWNNLHAYSVNETDTVTFTTYKNFGLSFGTLDSYLNNPPAVIPPTKRNSFQFTMGLTYAIKSKY
ncbi:MAG TPA: DUF481 domain-containing protein [Terracidiphilus sp.]|nr:DUF481 domain-containing protein [Terracidiphilus sp.]